MEKKKKKKKRREQKKQKEKNLPFFPAINSLNMTSFFFFKCPCRTIPTLQNSFLSFHSALKLAVVHAALHFVLLGRVFANGPGDRGSIPGRVIPKT